MKPDVLELLADLIRRPSITPDDAGCQDLVADRLIEAGFHVRTLRFGETTNLWATHGTEGPLYVLAGHTDVVPPGPREAWDSEPFIPTFRNGTLVGRGAVDMKASVAAMTVALVRLVQSGHQGRVALLLTSDEEASGRDGTQRVLAQLQSEGVEIAGAIVGEPTSEETFGDAVKIGRRGSLNGKLVFQGVQGHTAYPQLAENAAHRLAEALPLLLSLDWGPEDGFPATTLQVNHLHAGTGAPNVIPGHAEIGVNLRYGPSWTAGMIQARIADAMGPFQVSIQWQPGAEPFLTPPGPLVDALEAAVEAETGVRPRRSNGGGTSDARFFAALDIPVAEFGPRNATIHAANERVELDHLEPLARVYESTLAQLLDPARFPEDQVS